MPIATVSEVSARLRSAADSIRGAFPETHWKRILGPGPDEYVNKGGLFDGLVLEPGQEVHLQCNLNLPETVCGVRLAGDGLFATLASLYPVDLFIDGRSVFSEGGVPVAAGPALFPVLECLAPGDNGVLDLHIRVPAHQTTIWLNLQFQTSRLRARFELYDVAWAQLEMANALASTDAERQAVTEAAALVPEDLFPGDENALMAVLQRMADRLAPLNEKIKALRVHVVGHSHIDMNWMWLWDDTKEVIKRDFRNVLAMMDDYPELTFTHSQPATYEVARTEEPALFARIKQRISEGRWEPATMTWVEGDLNMAAGEAHAQQFLEGVHYSREMLGVQPSTFLAPDTFGHPGNLPQLAASAGVKRYYHHRCNPGGFDQWPLYWWEGDDGSRILNISTWSYNGEITARDLASAALHAHKHGYSAACHVHGIGDHGGGPSRQNLDALRRFQKTSLLPTSFCSRLDNYTDDVLKTGGPIPTWKGETSVLFEGCFTTHADTKRYNRTGENLLTSAQTLAAVTGVDAREQLSEAWRKVCFHQFHDILDGSAIHESYEMTRVDFEEVQKQAANVTDACLPLLVGEVADGDILLVNALAQERTEWVTVPALTGSGSVQVTDAAGRSVAAQYTPDGLGFAATVGALAVAAYRVQAGGDALADLTVRDTGLYFDVQTPHFRAQVRKDCGIVVSLFDKRVSRELVAFGMCRPADYTHAARTDLALNVLQILHEAPHGMTAWHMDEITSEQNLINGAETKVVEQGAARMVLETLHHVETTTIRQRMIFYRDLARIDFESDIDWQHLGTASAGIPDLKVAFTARLNECEAWYETPFAAAKRPSDGQEHAALRWADVGGPEYGIAVLNDAKYGYDALGCRLRLTLLRSGCDPDLISDLGKQSVRYSLVPHPGDWRDADIVRAAASYNQPLLICAGGAAGSASAQCARPVANGAAGSASAQGVRPIVKGGKSVLLSTLKQARDGRGVIARLYESEGRTAQIELGGLPVGAVCYDTSVVEDDGGPLTVDAGTLRLTFKPWQVRTIRILPA